MSDDKHERGMNLRRQVMGTEYVDSWLAGLDDFTVPLEELVTEYAWGAVWGRPGLVPATRSLLTLVMLVAMNRPEELRLHVRGALRNGCSVDEIREALLQTAVYCGLPAARQAFTVAREVLQEHGHI